MSKINYKAFNATNAKFITTQAEKNEIKTTIDIIVKAAENGNDTAYLKEKLNHETIISLLQKKFKVDTSNNLFKTIISW